MAIKRVYIKDFLAFKGEFQTDFCPGVNVIIGGNGTGKTTLLKCLYGATDRIRYSVSRYFDIPSDNPGFGGSPDDARICTIEGSMDAGYNEALPGADYPPIVVWLSQSDEWRKLDDDFNSAINEIASHSEGGKKLNEQYEANPTAFNINKKSVMIPAMEMLSHSRGLLALYHQFKIPFDQTEIDILIKAQLPETRDITSNAEKTLEQIREIIGGEVIYENDAFYLQKQIGNKVPFSLEASGFKRLGLLWRILRNGWLERGSTLLWDEPENSLNPEVESKLVDVLLGLSRNGVQIFIATHSEILASYFAVNRRKGDSVMFYSLYKDGEQIKTNKSDRFDLLEPNNLKAEIVSLYEKEIERGLGGNG